MKQIRESKFSKIVAYYLMIMMFLQVTQPVQMYALTSGPTQPEFSAFTPIGTSDMVDLASGDFNYNIPIMDVGGYPLNLAYNSGVTMDQEASWVGLGWNLNVGQIDRQVRGLPDDFKGDELTYENNLKKNQTVGFNFRVNPQILGFETGGSFKASVALNVQYNNYTGTSITPSYGVSYDISQNVSVGADLTTSATEGATVSPKVTFSDDNFKNKNSENGLSASLGLSYNSRQGLESINLSGSSKRISSATKGMGGTGNMNFSFVNNTFTPTIRNEFITKSGTFNASLGGDFWGVDGEVGVGAFFSSQKLKKPFERENAYGYEYTSSATERDITDFNRENDRTVSKKTRVLPVTNYTYDVYNIQAQGVSGSFRPYSGQVGYVFDPQKNDESYSGSGGIEVEFGAGGHIGGDVQFSWSDVNAGSWNTPAKTLFTADKVNKIDYEEKYYKSSSDLTVDDEMSLYTDRLASNKAMHLKLLDINSLYNKYDVKNVTNHTDVNSKIKRQSREKRNQSIHKVTKKEAAGDAFIAVNPNANDHHTAGIKVLNNDGSTYVFGETVYNTAKHEVSFAVHKDAAPNGDGIVSYTAGDASGDNGNGIDRYFNRVSTPAFANTYLISSALSSDYEDLTGNGPTDDDLGTYTKFTYKNLGNYQWRAPYYGASYNPGFNSDRNHKRASYTHGVKESKYITRIETKTHVAIFKLSPRKDGQGVNGELNNSKNISSTSVMYKIDQIDLYSKPEAIAARLLDDISGNDLPVTPIKTAHFVYNYALCKGIDNNNKSTSLVGNEIANQYGKLTLKKVYFTYRDSKMGKYTPYVFDYKENDVLMNPDYDMKSFDTWGNFKQNNDNTGRMLPSDVISSVEFPYVEQPVGPADSVVVKDQAAKNTGAWSLKIIKLPSGGQINIETESDDYQFVQDKKAMQMFKVVGVTKGTETNFSNSLFSSGVFGGNTEAKRLIVQIDPAFSNQSAFINAYIGEHIDKPIFFRFMLNMLKTGANNYDYVEGYFKIDKGANFQFFTNNGKSYAGIPMELTDMEGGVNGGKNVNPISKAGWYFGRQNMNKTVYGLHNDPSSENVFDIINAIGGSFRSVLEIFMGPNGRLRNEFQCAQKFIPAKSWIRLLNPNGSKLGGGARVKSVRLSDKWGKMLDVNLPEGGSDLNTMEYGQTYEYKADGRSSGVATYEPLGAKDNPIIEPFYDSGERLVAPKEVSYVEKPFGASFYPSPMVTYSKVTVKNLPRTNGSSIVKKHATGSVVTEFYTTKDFPTKADFTEIVSGDNLKKSNPSPVVGFLQQLLGVPVIDETKLTMSQGFVVETNDMNGKQKSQKVYDENEVLISGVDYKYNIENNQLDNNLTVINSNGLVSNSLVGVNYDVINDFRKNYSKSQLAGLQGNVAFIPIPFIPPFVIIVVTGFPSYASHTNELRMATTTKVVNKKGILKETIAYDLGSNVSTKNLAWDANSGEVILTETKNEYDDHYFSFTYPAYWKYDGMGLASSNIGMKGTLVANSPVTAPGQSNLASNDPHFKVEGYTGDLRSIFHLGDELYTPGLNISPNNGVPDPTQMTDEIVEKLWVVGFKSDNKSVLLMDRNGKYINKCDDITRFGFKIVRSGYRNLQAASMATVTSMVNPLRNNDSDPEPDILDQNSFIFNQSSTLNPRIVNANAVVYNDFWNSQIESELPYYPEYNVNLANANPINQDGTPNYPYNIKVNPYVWNIKGDWRAEKSYAYLTGRNASSGLINNPRNEGFFNSFSPFYKFIGSVWTIDTANWTDASSITKYSPFGAELENKDALSRHSSAQFGYQYKLPMAVASNSRYRQMGYEGFEEVKTGLPTKHFGFDADPDNVSVKQSHTGRSSLKVKKGQSTFLSRNLFPSIRSIAAVTCPTVSGGTGSTGCFVRYVYSNYAQSLCLAAEGESWMHRSIRLVFASNVVSIGTPIPDGYGSPNSMNPTLSYAPSIPGNSTNLTLCIYADYNGQHQSPSSSSGRYFDLPVTLAGGIQCRVRIEVCTLNGGSGTSFPQQPNYSYGLCAHGI